MRMTKVKPHTDILTISHNFLCSQPLNGNNKYFTSREVFLMLSLRKVADASEISQKNGYLTLFKTFLKPL